ncbi:Hypp2850 [Branchiostoma lanceolatum]|uniref:Hypp2850 protein n=1 Tax=Branchiostoma lanceolatum TaxID=7740 RepID=A0A8K0EPR4_BRALA|nr:Hypp2850 [Branchiostoma lanceolatum]
MDTMHEVNATTRDEYGLKAGGVLAALERFNTLFALRLGQLLFSSAEEVSTTLQTKDLSVQEAVFSFTTEKRAHQRFALLALLRDTGYLNGSSSVNSLFDTILNKVGYVEAKAQAADALVFPGRLYPVRYVIANITSPTKSPVFSTGELEWRLVMLPPTRHPDNYLGMYINLVSEDPIVINTYDAERVAWEQFEADVSRLAAYERINDDSMKDEVRANARAKYDAHVLAMKNN